MVAGVIYHLEQDVAYVTVRHSKRFNAMRRAMWLQLRDAFEQIQLDARVRCVVLSGHGEHFCSGGDISEYANFRFEEASLRHFHEHEVWGALHAMLCCDVPMVAQISGNCMGAGIELASCCDIRLAADSAQFGAPIAKLGFPMAPREALLVACAVGQVTARQMLLEAAVFSAPEMLQRGFLSQVVPAADLKARVQHTAQRIVQLAPQAARLNKQTLRAASPLSTLLHASGASQTWQQLEQGAYAYAPLGEQREGISAFLEKRSPDF